MTLTQNRFGWRSYTLGVFILFQLVYLPAANFIKLIALRLPESTGELDDDIQLHGQQFPDRVQAVADTLGTAFVRYGELTGQAQGWSLFAPIFGHQASLPMIAVAIPATPGSHGYLLRKASSLGNRELFRFDFRAPTVVSSTMNIDLRFCIGHGMPKRIESQQRRMAKRRSTSEYFGRIDRSKRFLNWRFNQVASRFPADAGPRARWSFGPSSIQSPEMSRRTLHLGQTPELPISDGTMDPGAVRSEGMLPVQAWQHLGQYDLAPESRAGHDGRRRAAVVAGLAR